MFGRKKKTADDPRPREVADIEDEDLEPAEADDAETGEADDTVSASGQVADVEENDVEDDEDSEDEDESDEDEEDDDSDEEDDDEPDEWEQLEQSRDWRDDGPFDFEEVDLEGDEVQRMDFGSIIMTPPDNGQLQLQVDQETQAVQAALMMLGNSGLELALFAAPRSGGLAKQVREEMMESVNSTGGSCEFAEGPFGVEVRRIVPVTTPDGQDALHVSRTWMAEGPRWLLRGVLMGEACVSQDPQAQDEFVEFFKNIVVKRGEQPMPPGDLIPMTLPDELRPPQQ